IIAAPLSPDHVFDFPEDDPAHDIKELEEEPKEEPKEKPEEESEEEAEEGHEEVTGVSPITPPPFSESSSDSEFIAHVTASRTHWMPPYGSTFKVGGPSSASSLPPRLLTYKVKKLMEDTKILFSGVRCLERGARTRHSEDATTRTRVDRLSRRMDAYDVDLRFIERDATGTSDHVLELEEDNLG
ncbi:hypothetical protein Tco_1537929, partial [Tanacetum coccineum]